MWRLILDYLNIKPPRPSPSLLPSSNLLRLRAGSEMYSEHFLKWTFLCWTVGPEHCIVSNVY